MSILICGMDIPKNEPLLVKINPDGSVSTTAKNGYKKYDAVPAADVRPVVRGKWTLNKDGSGTCSECGRKQLGCWDLDNWDNFCHFCGADMREEN